FLHLLADETPGPAHVNFKLPASGGSLVLYDGTGTQIDGVNYGPETEGVSQGRLPDGGANIVFFPGSASPKASNYLISYGGPILNEILARNQTGSAAPWGARSDWIELANTNTTPFALGGFGLSDEPGRSKWLVPSGVILDPGAHLRIWCADDAP